MSSSGQRWPNEARETEEDTTIPPFISLSQAAESLGVERRYLKGYAEASGIVLQRIPPQTLAMSIRDLEKLRRKLGQPEPTATASA